MRSQISFTSFDERMKQINHIQVCDVYYAFSHEHPRMVYVDDYENIDSINSLTEKSDVIARVRYKSRRQENNIMITEVEVLDLYKGNTHKSIFIYELGYISSDKEIMTLMSPTFFIQENQDYFVFLKQALPENQDYYNIVNTCLGLYPIKDELVIKRIVLKDERDIMLSLSDVKKYSLLDISYSLNQEEKDEKKSEFIYHEHIEKYKKYASILFEKYLHKKVKVTLTQ